MREIFVKYDDIVNCMVDNAHGDGYIVIEVEDFYTNKAIANFVSASWIDLYEQQHGVIVKFGFCPSDGGYFQEKDTNDEYIDADAWSWLDDDLQERLISEAKEHNFDLVIKEEMEAM